MPWTRPLPHTFRLRHYIITSTCHYQHFLVRWQAEDQLSPPACMSGRTHEDTDDAQYRPKGAFLPHSPLRPPSPPPSPPAPWWGEMPARVDLDIMSVKGPAWPSLPHSSVTSSTPDDSRVWLMKAVIHGCWGGALLCPRLVPEKRGRRFPGSNNGAFPFSFSDR